MKPMHIIFFRSISFTGAMFCLFPLVAQNSLGGQVGLNLAKMNTFNGSAGMVESRVGLNAGFVFNHEVGPVFSIQPELHYSEQGYTISMNLFFVSMREEMKNTNITVPFLLKWSTPENVVRVFMNAGPFLSYWASCTIEHEASGLGNNVKETKTVSGSDWNDVNRFEFGLMAGVGLSIRLPNNDHITLNARFSQGLSNLIKNSGGDLHNQVTAFTIGYMKTLGD